MKQATFFGILNFPIKNETFKIFANIFKRPISISLTTEWYQRIKSVKLNNKTTHLTKKAYNQNEPRRSSIRSTTMSRSWKVRMQGQTPLHSPQAESFLPAATRRKKRRKGKRKKEAERRRAKRKREEEKERKRDGGARNNGRGWTICHSANVPREGSPGIRMYSKETTNSQPPIWSETNTGNGLYSSIGSSSNIFGRSLAFTRSTKPSRVCRPSCRVSFAFLLALRTR